MTPSDSGHIARLDGLRAVAVGLVLWVHLPYVADSWLSKALWSTSHAVRAGYVGVDIFFALSGFLITRLLIDERERNGRVSLKRFYMRRALRIFPIYYLAVLAAQFLAPGSGGLLAALTYTTNFFHPFHPEPHPLEHTWSLCVEEHFYLLWPFVLSRLPLRLGFVATGMVIPLACAGAAVAIATRFDGPLAAELIYMSTPTRILSLSLGASLAFEERDRVVRSLAWAPLMLLTGGAVLAFAFLARAKGLLAPGGVYWCFGLIGYALVSRAILTIVVFERRRWFARVRHLLESAPARYVGRISYGLYLYHYLVLFALGVPAHLTAQTGASGARVAAAWLLTFLAAGLSYRFIETPLLGLKARYAAVAPGPAASARGAAIGGARPAAGEP